MELELKILKEKVIDDEKKQGIGSLVNDEKSSFFHIDELKKKYLKMRRDFDKEVEESNQKKLHIMGEQFILKSQIDILQDQKDKMIFSSKKDKDALNREFAETRRKFDETQKAERKLMNEILEKKNLQHDEHKKHKENKLYMETDNTEKNIENIRYDIQMKNLEDLKIHKTEKLAKLNSELQAVEAKFKQNTQLWDLYKKEGELKVLIHEATVTLEMRKIEVENLTDEVVKLNMKEQEMQEERKISELKN